MSAAVLLATSQTEAAQPDLRRITEDDPDYQQLHSTTVARLQRSVRQYAREVKRGDPGADTRFINRHIALMRQAYEAAHHQGQRDYWPAVSQRTVQHRFVKPDSEQTNKRLAYYALGSVLKMAHEVPAFQRQQQVAALDESPETLTLAAPTTDVPSNFDNRTVLQGQIVWSGLQDGYAAAGASDSASPYALLYWNLGDAKQHCLDCPDLAFGSPYDPPWSGAGSNQLTQSPGDGQTECGAACKCSLSYEYPSGDALNQLNQAIADRWTQFMATDSPLPALSTGAQPKKGTMLTPLQRGFMDEFRNAQAAWDEARGSLPAAPGMFNGGDWTGAKTTPWGAMTPYQRNILARMEQAQIDWLHAVGQLNWPVPAYTPDQETAIMKWLNDVQKSKRWVEPPYIPSPEEKNMQWLADVAKANLWPEPPIATGDDESNLMAWLATVEKTMQWPPNVDYGMSYREETTGTILLVNNYPRQAGGRFGFGPGGTTSGGGAKGTKGTAKSSGSAKAAKSSTKAAKATKAAAASVSGGGSSSGSSAPTIEDQKAAAEKRLKDAQKQSNKAERDFKKAEKDAAAKQIANADEIKALQEEHSAAYIREFHSYSDAKEAIAEERAIAKGEAGKAPVAYAKMQAAKQPYEDAKAEYAAAKATSDASKAIADELQNRYSANYDFSKYGSYDKMLKDHPDLKAAQRQSWKDKTVANKAQARMWRAQSKYTTPRDQLAGKIDDATINAYPERIAAKAALADVTARLGEANGQTALRAAFDARSNARLELKDAQSQMAHPTWNYPLRSVPTTHALYTNVDQWPTGTLAEAQAANPGGHLDVHVGDVALSQLESAQGFAGPSDIVSEADLQNYINNGETELWRGDSKQSHTDEMMLGEYHAGLGIRGNGTYAQEGADGISTARSYAGNRGTSSVGTMMRMSVKGDARVINYDDLRSQAHSAFQRAQSDEQAARARGDTAGARRARAVQWLAGASNNTSAYAVALGYDAIRIPSHGQWIILNRTAIRVSHQIRGV